jgi:hypothetical protein
MSIYTATFSGLSMMVNQTSVLVLGVIILSMWCIIFTASYDRSSTLVFGQQPVGNATSPSNPVGNPASIGIIKGNIGSLQNNETGQPAWVTIGEWNSTMALQPLANKTNVQQATFSANIHMVKPDGTAMHKHQISNLKLNKGAIDNMTAILNGTVTVDISDDPKSNVQPKNNVPISIKALALSHGSGAISIWLDPTKVEGHFGTTPIYGVIWNTENSPLAPP